MKLLVFILALIIPLQAGAAERETAFDRVMRTGVLRCGYADWPPYVLTKDPQTGKISGILFDVTEEIASRLNLKVEWTENTGWGSYIESLIRHGPGHVSAPCQALPISSPAPLTIS